MPNRPPFLPNHAFVPQLAQQLRYCINEYAKELQIAVISELTPLNQLLRIAGLLRLPSAKPHLQQALKHAHVLPLPVFIWAMGRCKVHKANAFLTTLPHEKLSVTNALLAYTTQWALLRGKGHKSLQQHLFNALPNTFQQAIKKAAVKNLLGYIGLSFEGKKNAAYTIGLLYILSHKYTSIRKALVAWLEKPMYNAKAFYTLRVLLKIASFRDDEVFFGLIAYQIAHMPTSVMATGITSTDWLAEDRESQVMPPINASLSVLTQKYMCKKIWKDLQFRAQWKHKSYMPLAIHVLLAFNATTTLNTTAEKGTLVATLPMFMQQSAAHGDNQHFLWNKILRENNTVVRTEAFPELWDTRLDLVLYLLVNSIHENMHMVARVIVKQKLNEITAFLNPKILRQLRNSTNNNTRQLAQTLTELSKIA